ncbi:autotransporter outer membrane beta-barrel domain-containing protein [Spirosoma litoris]
MKNSQLLVGIYLVCLPTLLKAQYNYVVNSVNNSTSGSFNTLVGPVTGQSVTTGARNTAVGYAAGHDLSTGADNIFIGAGAGQYNSTGNGNVFVGSLTGYYNTDGGLNTFVGQKAGYLNTTGGLNLYLGYQSGYNNDTGGYNSFLGAQAGYANTTGSSNVFTGYQAGYRNTTGSTNVFSGIQAGYHNTSGNGNVFTGYVAGYFNTTGGSNMFCGNGAGYSNTTGGNNVFSGYSAGFFNTTGVNNTFIGYLAGQYNTIGNNNIIIGPNSGTAITTSDDNILMGYNSQAEDGLQNAIAIGANSRVAASNALILGNQVNVGIGTSAPTNRLEVLSQSTNSSGLTLTNLTTASPTTRTTDQFLTVSETGEVVKARYQLRITDPSVWSDKVFSSDYSLRPLIEVASFVQSHQHLPGVPSAEQVAKEGIDLVKMNATLLEKVEELTLYSIQLERTNQHQEARIDQLEKQHKKEIEDLKQLISKRLNKQ